MLKANEKRGDKIMAYTTELGYETINEAQRWLAMECVEKPLGSNKVYCKNHLNPNELMMWGTEGAGQAWCGSFCYKVVNNAVENIGMKGSSRIKQEGDGSRNWKAAATWKNLKDNNMRVNREPAPGCVFWRPQSHVGIVVQVFDDGGIAIIHGNSGSNNVTFDEYINPKNLKNYKFVHTEMMFGDIAKTEAPVLLAPSDIIVAQNKIIGIRQNNYAVNGGHRREAWN